jgi:RNA polymerase sigma-70 factor, ECF subfamily
MPNQTQDQVGCFRDNARLIRWAGSCLLLRLPYRRVDDEDAKAKKAAGNDAPDDASASAVTSSGSQHAREPQSDAQRAVAEMFAEHAEAVFGYCYRVVRDRVLAEDLMQQVFLEACRDLQQFRKRSSVRTWLLAIAGNRCIDMLRRKGRTAARMAPADAAVDEVKDPAADALEQIERRQLHTSLEECLQELSPETRATVLLRYLTELTYEEMVQEKLGPTRYALQMRVSRAMPALRECLERKGWTDE